MGRFSLWRLRAGWLQWIFVIIPISVIWAIVQEWILGDLIDYIRSILGVDMNIIELALRMPITIIAIVGALAIGIWIFRSGSKDSALRDLYKLLWDIRRAESLLVASALPSIIAQHHKEFHQEVDFLVLQSLRKKRGARKDRELDITPEELSSMRIERLIPENAELESLRNNPRNKDTKLPKLWERVRLLQTAFMDDILDRQIVQFERMLKLNSAYKVYKEVLIRCYIIDLNDYGTLNQSVKVTEDALAKAHREVNRRLSELVHNKELSKEWSKGLSEVTRQI